jgi:hypothetical protein
MKPGLFAPCLEERQRVAKRGPAFPLVGKDTGKP